MNSQQAVIFVNHWPEPMSSAAGLRTREMSSFLQRLGYEVVGIAPGPASEHSSNWTKTGVRTLSCDPNQSSIEQTFALLKPEVVIYDRFYMEEQYGWRARELWPEALHILDTSDIHCIRRARQRAVAANLPWPEVMTPPVEMFEEDILREMAALHRVDVSLVVSSFEQQWLESQGLDAERILLLPFSSEIEIKVVPFEERQGFCFLGNFLHAPNLDAVKWLESELWPALRQKMPKAELHLYGAYPPQVVTRHKGKDGIYSHGAVDDHRKALSQHKALIAPLRYGAGIKGKVLEAWATGTPAIGTPITFEGICNGHPQFMNATEFVEQVTKLEDADFWKTSIEQGQAILTQKFTQKIIFQKFKEFLPHALASRNRWRSSLTGRMLRHHGSQSVKYLSRWIEEKNKTTASTKFSHLEINVTNYAESIRFYDKILLPLGWERLVTTKDCAVFCDGLLKLILSPVSEKHRSTIFHRKQVGLNHLAFYCSSKIKVDEYYETVLKSHKISVLYDGSPQGNDDYYAVLFEDPDRIKLEVVYAPNYCKKDSWPNNLVSDFDPQAH